MMKITFYQKLLAAGASSILSLSVLGLWIGATARDVPPTKNTPVIDFSYLCSPNLAFASVNPFPSSGVEGLLISNNSSLPANLSMPTPKLPGSNVSASTGNRIVTSKPIKEVIKVEVIGLLPPDVAILRKGEQTITARMGNTAFGYLSAVTDTGVEINEEWIEYKK